MRSQEKLEVRSAARKGRGIFAKSKISKGEVIEVAPCLILSLKDSKLVSETDLIRFVYDAGRSQTAIAFGYASLYNHADLPNATYSVNRRRRVVTVKALRDIKRGEEITIDYGYHPAQPETWADEYARLMSGRRRRRRRSSRAT